jgi:hypothetical protein
MKSAATELRPSASWGAVGIADTDIFRTLPGEHNMTPYPTTILELEPKWEPFGVGKVQHGPAARDVANRTAHLAVRAEDDLCSGMFRMPGFSWTHRATSHFGKQDRALSVNGNAPAVPAYSLRVDRVLTAVAED